MPKFLIAILFVVSAPAMALTEKLTCFDTATSNGYFVTVEPNTLRVEFSDMVTKDKFYATGDIFAFGTDMALFLSTEQLDQDGREMMAEACRLNPEPNKPVVNVMLWSGKLDGTTPIADLCLTCLK